MHIIYIGKVNCKFTKTFEMVSILLCDSSESLVSKYSFELDADIFKLKIEFTGKHY
jgi:hypothetical protein